MESARGNTMLRQTVFWVILVAFAMISGCNTLGKKEAEPDHFEKWRAIAEESRGNTPDPRKYDLEVEKTQRPGQMPWPQRPWKIRKR